MERPHLRLAPALVDLSVTPDPAAGTIRLVLADDHAQMRRSLRLLLDTEGDIEVIAEANDLAAVWRQLRGRLPHVLVLDLGMLGGSGGEPVAQLRERVPETQIVIVTMEDSPAFAQRALAAGALGYVAKELADEELPQAIRCAAQGARYVSPRFAPRLAALGSPRPARPPLGR